MDNDQGLRAAYLLALLVLPAGALLRRYNPKTGRAQRITAQFGDHTYEGDYWVDDGIVYVRCSAGRKGRLIGPQGPGRTAEELLIDIYRDEGRLQS